MCEKLVNVIATVYMNIGVTLKRTAILMVSSLILSPREETGGVFSSLALDSTSLHDVRMVSKRMSILGLSQGFWLLVEVGTSVSGGKSCFHTLRVESLSSY